MRLRLLSASIAIGAGLATASAGQAQDAAAGATLFKQRCAACHSTAPGAKSAVGPNLAGVAGRKAGQGDFNYSPALRSSGITWDKAKLDSFLAAPKKLVPGTRMVIGVPNAQQRANIVAYLHTLKK